ncbi:hypothetical protein BSKO_08598 [Bryopsis sp. KO-2023]|nr:hypothetical protein BSKO_08598 [Bryopsis sp. KO-2023]
MDSACGEKCIQLGSTAGGVLFGVGWAVWVDAVIMNAVAQLSADLPWQYYLPGPLATLAFFVMNCTSRESIKDADEEDEVRARFWLCVSYSIAVAAGIFSIWTVFDGQHHDHEPEYAWSGAACMIQCGFILAGGLVMWSFRPSD